MPFEEVEYAGDEQFIADAQRVAPDVEDPSTLSVSAAAMRRENLAASAIEWAKHRSGDDPVPGYNGLADMPDDLLAYSDDFAEAESPGETQLLIDELRLQNDDKEILARAGWEGVAWQVGAAVADPINLIPLFWPAKLAKLAALGRTVATGTRAARAAKTAAAVGIAETALAGVTEAGLQATQRDRELQETLINVGGAALMGSMVGAASGALSAPQKSAIAAAIDQDLRRTMPEVAAEMPAREMQISKISVIDSDAIDRTAPVVFGTMGAPSMMTPMTRLDASPFPTAVRTKDLLAHHSMIKQSNLEGIASAPATELQARQMKQGLFSAAKRDADNLYGELKNRGGVLSKREFNEAVGTALSNGDKAANPEIAKAARIWRTTVFDKVHELLVRNKMLEGDASVKWAQSYFPRVYDSPNMLTPEWNDLLNTTFMRNGKTLEEAQEITAGITDAIVQAPTSRLYHDWSPPGADPEDVFDARTLPIPDNILADGGFLIKDVEEVATRYLHTYVPDVLLHQRFGSVDMAGQFKQLSSEHQALQKGKSARQLKKLQKQYEAAIKDLTLLRDRIRGTDALPPKEGVHAMINRVATPLNAATSMTYLGGQTEAAITDVGLAQIKQGFGPMVKGFVNNVLPEYRRLAREEQVAMGVGIDNFLNSRSYALTYADETATQGVARWMTRHGTPLFGKMSLMTYWNTMIKHVSGGAVQLKSLNLADKIAAGKSVSQIDRAILARHGVDEAMAKRISNQAGKYGYKNKLGGRLANTAKWQDTKAARIYELLVLGEVDNSIVTPGAADVPSLTSTQFGKFLFKFQSFMFGAQNQIYIPALQRLRYGDNRKRLSIVAGVSSSLALGALVEESRRQRRGRVEEMSEGDWVKAAADRSGVFGMWPVLYDVTDRFAGGTISDTMGLTPAWNANKDWRVGDAAPQFGLIEDGAHAVAQARRDMLDPEQQLDKDNLKDFWRVFPFQNLFWLQWMMRGDDDEITVE